MGGTKKTTHDGDVKAKTKTRREPRGSIYLTFDDGPHPATEGILQLLYQLDAPAAFFINAADDPDDPHKKEKQKDHIKDATPRKNVGKIVHDIVGYGHVLGNHTYSHWPMKKSAYMSEHGVADAQRGFEVNRDALKRAAPLWTMQAARLPAGGPPARPEDSGARRDELIEMVRTKVGLPHVYWGFELADVAHRGRNASLTFVDWQGVKGVVATGDMPRAGAVVLLHDMDWGGAHLEMLRKVILKLRELAFTIAPLWEPLERRDTLDDQIVYPDDWKFNSSPE